MREYEQKADRSISRGCAKTINFYLDWRDNPCVHRLRLYIHRLHAAYEILNPQGEEKAEFKASETADAIYQFYRRIKQNRKASGRDLRVGSDLPKPLNLEFDNELEMRSKLLDIEDNLEFISDALKRSHLRGDKAKEVHNHIEAIKKKQMEPSFYVAVIGEFSSGKSTLINALLREELLETSPPPSTAVETEIRYGTSPYGTSPYLDVAFLRGGSLYHSAFWPSPAQAVAHFLLNESEAPMQNHGLEQSSQEMTPFLSFVSRYTASEESEHEVAKTRVFHTAKALERGIVLIDTPGLNSSHPKRSQIVQKVIEETADIAIVTIPAPKPVSRELYDFVQGKMFPSLPMCIFVVTQIDMLSGGQQEKQILRIRSRLSGNGKNVQPLYTCAPQVFLDSALGRELKATDESWVEDFDQFHEELLEELARKRFQASCYTMGRMMDRLFTALSEGISIQLEQTRKNYEASQYESADEFGEFFEKCLVQGKKHLEHKLSGVEDEVNANLFETRQNLSAEILEGVKKIQSPADRSQLSEKVCSLFERAKESLEKKVDTIVNNGFKTAITQAACMFEQKLFRRYREILMSQFPKLPSFIEYLPETFELPQELMQSIQPSPKNASKVSRIDKAIGDTFLGFIKGSNESLSMDFEAALGEFFDGIKSFVEDYMRKESSNVDSALSEHLAQHVENYQAPIEEYAPEWRERRKELKEVMDRAQEDLQEIERRKKSLKRKMEKLA